MDKTTYILSGGNDRNYFDYAGRLYDEIAKRTEKIKFLSCFYAEQEATWSERADDWKAWLSDSFPVAIEYDYARKEDFLEQLDAANVIFFHGGRTDSLLKSLPDAEQLVERLKGKIVIGSSAGANMLSKHYWSSNQGIPRQGLGILDMNIMVHYGAKQVGDNKRTTADWQREERDFSSVINRLITRLSEAEIVVIEQ